jgi:hypothetical protein
MKTYTKDTPYSEIDMPTCLEEVPLWVREHVTCGPQPGDENLQETYSFDGIFHRTQEMADMSKRHGATIKALLEKKKFNP